VVVVWSDHTVVDRLSVRRLGVLVSSLLVQKHICVLELFLPSFTYIFCIAYIASIVLIDYHYLLFVRFT